MLLLRMEGRHEGRKEGGREEASMPRNVQHELKTGDDDLGYRQLLLKGRQFTAGLMYRFGKVEEKSV